MATQLLNAKRGNTTDEMKFVANQENIDVEILKEQISKGKVVILRNSIRDKSIPVGVGNILRTKILTRVGLTKNNISIDKELDKIRVINQAGCDVLMDVSTGNLINEAREAILSATTLPVVINPLLQAAIESTKNSDFLNVTEENILSVVEKLCADGVDCLYLDCAATKECFEKLKNQKRVMGLASQSALILAEYIEKTKNENPLYSCFDKILEIIKPYDITLLIANTLKPSCTMDSGDIAIQYQNAIQAELAEFAREYGIQTMIENVGYTKIENIEAEIKTIKKLTKNAPLLTDAMISDSTTGFDNINSAISSTIAGLYGADMIYSVCTGKNLIYSNSSQTREGVVTAKVAAHCIDYSKNIRIAKTINDENINAKLNNNWKKQQKNSIDELALNSLEKQYQDCDYFASYISKQTIENYKKESDE